MQTFEIDKGVTEKKENLIFLKKLFGHQLIKEKEVGKLFP